MPTSRSLGLAVLLNRPLLCQAQPGIQVGFSPEGKARPLVLETIGGVKPSIPDARLSLPGLDIAQALVNVEARGVEVRIGSARSATRKKANKKAMAPWPQWRGVRTNDRFHIHRDKTIIVDGHAMKTGRSNFESFAQTMIQRGVVVIRDAPEVARR